MTTMVDIRCPSCENAQSVRKLGIGEYHCTDCGREFTQDDVPQP